MYFDNIKTLDEAKNLFRSLCMELHPDTSGKDSGAEFIRMYNEFKKFKPLNSSEDINFDASKFYDLLKSFDDFVDIKLNFVGSFIWIEDLVYGASYRQRTLLKSLILPQFNSIKFAPVKKAWYFSPVDYVQKSKGISDLDEIKRKYGSESFELKSLKKIA